MSDALDLYLAELERGLGNLPRGRRRLFLRELHAHLLDEAQARGLESEAELRLLISEKEPPALLAAEIAESDEGSSSHRGEAAILAGSLIGIATGVTKWVMGAPWYLCLGWGVALGLALCASLFSLRRHWQRHPLPLRLTAAILLGTFLAIPLGFTGQGFWGWRLCYGAFLGYMVERHCQRRPLWQLLADTLGFTVLTVVVDLYFFCPEKHFEWLVLGRLLCLNSSISFALLWAMALNRLLSERWVLASKGRALF